MDTDDKFEQTFVNAGDFTQARALRVPPGQPVAHLVESILLPSKQVAPIFATTTISTTEGQTLSGLVIEENERDLTLLLPTAARQTINGWVSDRTEHQIPELFPEMFILLPKEVANGFAEANATAL